MASTRALLRGPWSASKVQMALRCAREFHYRYIDKIKEPQVMPEARIGKAIHAALEQVLQGAPLPEALASPRAELNNENEQYRYDSISAGVQPFLDRIERFRKRRRVSRQMVEFTLGVREDFTATPFYSGDVFYRGVFDAGYLYGDGNMVIIDHKTGFRMASYKITEQLEGYAALAAASFRNVRRFWMGIHWVAEADIEWSRPIDQREIRERFVPRVLDNIEAAALAVDDGPRPTPSVWCERCAWRSMCPAAQEARFEPVDDEEEDPGL